MQRCRQIAGMVLLLILLLARPNYVQGQDDIVDKSCASEQISPAQLQIIRQNWDTRSLHQLSDDFPPDAPGYLAMKNHLGEEDGLRKPLRTGQEVAFYNALKAKIAQLKAAEKLGFAETFELGLSTAKAQNGKIYLPQVYLTIVNVVRLLARPEQWTGEKMPGDYGHPESDPAYPILQDVLGIRSSDKHPTLAAQLGLRFKPDGRVMNDQYSLQTLFGEQGVFKYMHGAPSASFNGGAHYYFWTGVLGQRYFATAGIYWAGWQELWVKWRDNELERGKYQVCHLHNGRYFSQGMREVTQTSDGDSDDLQARQQGILSQLLQKIRMVSADLEQLQALAGQSRGLCGQVKGQYRQAYQLDAEAEALMMKLRPFASAEERVLPCNAAQDLKAEIDALQLKTQEDEDKVIHNLDLSVALAATCNSQKDADEIVRLYKNAQKLAAKLQVDAAIARGKNNKLQGIKNAISAEGAKIQSILYIQAETEKINAQISTLASSSVALRDQLIDIELRRGKEQAELDILLQELERALPEQAPSPALQLTFDEINSAWAQVSAQLSLIGQLEACELEKFDVGEIVQMSLYGEDRFIGSDDIYAYAEACALVSTADGQIESIDGSASWVLAALEINKNLVQQASACKTPADGQPASKNQSFKPVHLFQLLNKQGETFYLLYARAEPSHLDKSKFRFPDGGGGYYHHAGTDLGVFKDSDSLCAVLRGKGVFNVSYNLQSWSVSCDKTGPIAVPQGTDVDTNRNGNMGGPSLAAQLLMLETVIGDVRIYLDGPEQAQPLTENTPVAAGATLVTARDAELKLSLPATSIEVAAQTQVRWQPGGAAGKIAAQLSLKQGSLLIEHSSGSALTSSANSGKSSDLPDFDGLEIVTPHARVRPQGTRYRVSSNAQGTEVEVMQGQILLTGKMLARTNAAFEIEGKYAFQTRLSLKAGKYARALASDFEDEAIPSWLDPQPAPADKGQAAISAGARSSLPQWLNGGSEQAEGTPSADNPLTTASPWLDPRVQQWMDLWLKQARPSIAKPGLSFRYSEWGVLLSSAATAAGPPDHPTGWSRYRYLWQRRHQLPSWNLCRLGEYLQHRQEKQSLDDCVEPPPQSPPQSQGSGTDKAIADESKPAAAELTKGKQNNLNDFSGWLGGWSCQYQAKNGDWKKMIPFGLSRDKDKLFLQYQQKRYPLQGLPQNNHYQLLIDFPGSPLILDLHLSGKTLAGKQSWTQDKLTHNQAIRCEPATPEDQIHIYGRR